MFASLIRPPRVLMPPPALEVPSLPELTVISNPEILSYKFEPSVVEDDDDHGYSYI
jgi:hypothetical protein